MTVITVMPGNPLRAPRALALAAWLLQFVAPLAAPAPAVARAPLRAEHGVVSSASQAASAAGVTVLQQGGNAVDAAVATALALAVTWPCAGNLAGGGFMLIRLANGTATFIDYRETAPAVAFRESYLDSAGHYVPESSLYGPRAAGVPGTVPGLAYAFKHYGSGRVTWAQLVEPARRLAAEGYAITPNWLRPVRADSVAMARDPETRRIYLKGGRPWHPGDRFTQPELAATLARLARHGPEEFTTGGTARRIAATCSGWITLKDLQAYRVVERAPLRGGYRGYEVLTAPPPSSGGFTLLNMLGMLEAYDLKALGRGTPITDHLMVEIMRRGYADRAEFAGDPAFTRIPAAALASVRYASHRMVDIDPARATPSRDVSHGDPLPYEPTETTHFSVVDLAGNVVSNTYTLNGWFGAKVTVPGTGLLLNNEMDDFSANPGHPNLYGLVQSEKNAVGAGRRPASSMTPTIVLRDHRPFLALGSRGGSTITNVVLQTILNVVDFGMNLQEAVDAPRIHHQWIPDELITEPGLMPDSTRTQLEAMGHLFGTPNPIGLGTLAAVMVDSTGMRLAAGDPRWDEGVAGY